jgi:hypothetical protein
LAPASTHTPLVARNIVIHKAAKIELGKKKDWHEYMRLVESTAKEG